MTKTDECKHKRFKTVCKPGKYYGTCPDCGARTWIKQDTALIVKTMKKIRRYPHNRVKKQGKNATLGGRVAYRGIWCGDHHMEKLDRFVKKFGFSSRSSAIRGWIDNLDF